MLRNLLSRRSELDAQQVQLRAACTQLRLRREQPRAQVVGFECGEPGSVVRLSKQASKWLSEWVSGRVSE